MLPGGFSDYVQQGLRASPPEPAEASTADGYSAEQEAFLRQSCCVLIESAGQTLKVYAGPLADPWQVCDTLLAQSGSNPLAGTKWCFSLLPSTCTDISWSDLWLPQTGW